MIICPHSQEEKKTKRKPQISTLADLVTAVDALVKELKQALAKGTGELAKALWQKLRELRDLLDAQKRLGKSAEATRRFTEAVDKLEACTSAPDSAVTVEVWQLLEQVLISAVK